MVASDEIGRFCLEPLTLTLGEAAHLGHFGNRGERLELAFLSSFRGVCVPSAVLMPCPYRVAPIETRCSHPAHAYADPGSPAPDAG